jgi:peptidoglycan/xylan/chitin deacetylase (PgdA/CDA1 family)
MLDGVLHKAGLSLVSWTRRGFDAVERDAAKVARRLLRGLAAGDILLLHDGSTVRRGGNPNVLEVLPRVLETLSARGLRSVAIEAPADCDSGFRESENG